MEKGKLSSCWGRLAVGQGMVWASTQRMMSGSKRHPVLHHHPKSIGPVAEMLHLMKLSQEGEQGSAAQVRQQEM